MNSIAEKCGIVPEDSKQAVAEKIHRWIESIIPDETPSHKADQAMLAWNAIHSSMGWEEASSSFPDYWGQGGMAAEERMFHRWGGPRPGSGRPPIDPDAEIRRITITLTDALLDHANRIGQGNISAGIRRALANYPPFDA